MATSAAMVVVRTDNAPKFEGTESGRRSIAEASYGEPDQASNDVGDPVQATEADAGQILTYSLSGTDAGPFSITQDAPATTGTDEGGQIRVRAGTKLDRETKSTYMVTVTATDSDNLSASIDVTINVTDVNEAPEVTGDAAIEYRENGTGSVTTFTADDPEDRTVYWSLADENVTEVDGIGDGDEDDFDDFNISSRGVLSFKFSPDYEMPRGMAIAADNTNTYRVVVVASDDPLGAEGMMGYKKVTVTVTNLDEPGEITFSSQQPQVDQPFTATFNDPEDGDTPTDLAWKWYHSSSRSGGSVIDGQVTGSYMPVEDVGNRFLRVVVTYIDGNGNDKTVMAVSANRVRAEPAANAAPAGTDTTRVVDENSPPGTNVGKPVTASDTAGDVLTYTLADNGDGANYSIDPGTGQITVGARTTLDADDDASDSVTVMATDPSGEVEAGGIAVTITIRDINEAPTITEGPTRVTLAENLDITADISTYTYEATDPESADVNDACDMDNCSLSLQGSDAGDFSISNESGTYGDLTFKAVPDYEAPADSNRDNVYMVTVVVTDNGVDGKNKMTAERDVAIMVTNLEEDGEVTLSAQQPKIGVALTASVTDLDGGVANVTWKWERDDDRANVDLNTEDDGEEVITGATSAIYTPTMDDEGNYLRAISTYTDGKGKDTSMATSAAMVVVRTDNAPKFEGTESGRRSIAEASYGEPDQA